MSKNHKKIPRNPTRHSEKYLPTTKRYPQTNASEKDAALPNDEKPTSIQPELMIAITPPAEQENAT